MVSVYQSAYKWFLPGLMGEFEIVLEFSHEAQYCSLPRQCNRLLR